MELELSSNLLAVWVHQIDPFLVEFTEGWGIRWYGTAYLVGALVGYLIIRGLAARNRAQVPPHEVDSLIVLLLGGALIGGRLGYCLFYQISLFGFTNEFPYWGVLSVHRGGMASHGGIMGVALVASLYAWRYKMSALHLCDLTAYAGCLGIVFGRIANFINGELYGRPCSSDLPWAVKFPQEIQDWTAASPEGQEKLVALGEVASKLPEPIAEGRWQELLRLGDGVAVRQIEQRIVEAVQSGNAEVIQTLEPLLTPRHPSQLYQGLLEGLLVFVILTVIWRKPRRPGVITGWAIILYAVARIIGEIFRTPDAHIGFELFGTITRGQWLSGLMMLIGALGMIYWSNRPVVPIGGWGPDGLPARSNTAPETELSPDQNEKAETAPESPEAASLK